MPGAHGRGDGGLLFHAGRGSVLQGERVVEVDGGDVSVEEV